MKDMIRAIVENGKTGMTAEQLEALPETAVSTMFAGLQLNEDEPEAEPAPANPEPQNDVPAWAASLMDTVGQLASKVDGLSATQNAAVEQQKTAVISRLMANERNSFTEDELKAFDLPQLEKLATALIPADYSGLFFGQNQQSDDYEYAGLTINVKEEAK